MSVIKALEQPNVEVETLIQQQKMRYESKSNSLLVLIVSVRLLLLMLFQYIIPCLPFLDRLEGDEDEPDLLLLSTLDFAALKDVRETGAEYCRSFMQLLHQTPGLQPGYLPQPDALYLLSGVSIASSVCLYASISKHCS